MVMLPLISKFSYYYSILKLHKCTILYNHTNVTILKRGMKKGGEGIVKAATKVVSENSSVLSSQSQNIPNVNTPQSSPQSSPNTSTQNSPGSSPQLTPPSSPSINSQISHNIKHEPLKTEESIEEKLKKNRPDLFDDYQTTNNENDDIKTTATIESNKVQLNFTPYIIKAPENTSSNNTNKPIHASIAHLFNNNNQITSTSNISNNNPQSTSVSNNNNNLTNSTTTPTNSQSNSISNNNNNSTNIQQTLYIDSTGVSHNTIQSNTTHNNNAPSTQQTLYVDSTGVSHNIIKNNDNDNQSINTTQSTDPNTPTNVPTSNAESNNLQLVVYKPNLNATQNDTHNNQQTLYIDSTGISHTNTQQTSTASTITNTSQNINNTVLSSNINNNNSNSTSTIDTPGISYNTTQSTTQVSNIPTSSTNNQQTLYLDSEGVSHNTTQPLFSTFSFKEELIEKSSNIGIKTEEEVKEFEYSISLKTISGKLYTTSLSKSTDVNKLTDQVVIEEMTKRELVKFDKTPQVPIKLQSGEEYVFTNKLGVKFSQLGQAYVSSIEKNKDTVWLPNHPTSNDVEFQIIIAPVRFNTFIESGKQKHMLAAYDKNSDEYHIIGYFTSKASGELFSEEQFKVFQAKLEDPNIPVLNKGKTQHFVPLNNAQSLASNEVKIAKDGAEYIKASNKTKYLRDILDKLEKKPYKEFDFSGISKEDCIKMCLEHDDNIKNKKPHPLTDDQVKLNQLNKEKQKDLTLSKDKDKSDKNTNINNNETSDTK